jgi:hypothetical protein
MLKPTKHSHPDRTIINVSLILLSRVRKRRIEDYDTLRNLVKKTVAGGDALFLPALSFLYLLGVIEYRKKTDSVEYVGSNETI